MSRCRLEEAFLDADSLREGRGFRARVDRFRGVSRQSGSRVAPSSLFLSAILLACAGSATAAPELEVGTVRGSPGAIVAVPVYFAPAGAAVAGLQLDLRFDAASLDPRTPSPGGAVLDHIVTDSTPASGTFRALLYSLTGATLTTGALIDVPFRISADATAGNKFVTMENVLLSNPSASAVTPALLAPGVVRVVLAPLVDQTLAINGSASDGRPDRTALVLTDLNSLELRYKLTAPEVGTCQVRLRIVAPDGRTYGPLPLQSMEQLRHVAGQNGNWTFLVQTSGGCSAQAFSLQIRPSALVLGQEPGLILVTALVFGAGLLLSRRARTRSTAQAHGSPGSCLEPPEISR